MASENPEFGMTLAGHLNQSCFFAELQSNSVAITMAAAEVRCLNWTYLLQTFMILVQL